jgi:hypothetical protein
LPHKPQHGLSFAAGTFALALFVDGGRFAALALAMRNAL